MCNILFLYCHKKNEWYNEFSENKKSSYKNLKNITRNFFKIKTSKKSKRRSEKLLTFLIHTISRTNLIKFKMCFNIIHVGYSTYYS